MNLHSPYTLSSLSLSLYTLSILHPLNSLHHTPHSPFSSPRKFVASWARPNPRAVGGGRRGVKSVGVTRLLPTGGWGNLFHPDHTKLYGYEIFNPMCVCMEGGGGLLCLHRNAKKWGIFLVVPRARFSKKPGTRERETGNGRPSLYIKGTK